MHHGMESEGRQTQESQGGQMDLGSDHPGRQEIPMMVSDDELEHHRNWVGHWPCPNNSALKCHGSQEGHSAMISQLSFIFILIILILLCSALFCSTLLHSQSLIPLFPQLPSRIALFGSAVLR